MEDSPLLHDHSTMEGRFSLCLHRLKWKYLIPPVMFLAAFAAITILIVSIESDINSKIHPPGVLQLTPGNSLLGKDDPALRTAHFSSEPDTDSEVIPGWTVIKQPTPDEVEAEGCENGLYTFEGFDSSVVSRPTKKSLRIRNLVINADELTSSLEEWRGLESIVMENVWINGNFSRVHLPNLKKFIYHQYKNGKTDRYKQPDTLKQTLFFDKSLTQPWDLNRDLLNLNMSIQLSVEGTKILDIEPDYGEINLNTHNCEDMLAHFSPHTFPLSTLSLNWCPVTNKSIDKLKEVKETLQFLFLNNAIPSSTQELGEITRSLQNLKELHLFHRFHCDWPGFEIFLNVSTLSPTLETLSVTNLDISWDNLGAPAIRNLSLDQYVGEELANNFPIIFPNLSSLALFNITQNRSYLLIEKVLFQVGSPPQLIIVTDLTRPLGNDLNGKTTSKKSKLNNNSSRDKAVAQAVSKVEQLLNSAGVPRSATSFQLSRESNTYVGKELTSFQRNFFRFQRLAFRKIDTYADYITWDAVPQ